MRVLIIENDEILTQVLTFLFGFAGYDSEVAHTAEDATRRLMSMNIHGTLPDLILADYWLGGVTIRPVHETLTTFRHPPPMVLMSGMPSIAKKFAEKAGVKHFLDKPFDTDVLLSCLSAATDARHRCQHSA